MTFFSGLSIEQNLATNRQSGLKRIEAFMQVMRTLCEGLRDAHLMFHSSEEI